MNYIKRTIFILISILVISGCASKQISLNKQHTTKTCTIIGVFSITYDKNKRNIFNFKWIQNQASYSIYIFSPMNIGTIAKIIGNDNEVSFYTKNNELLHNHLELEIPIRNMQDWILGKLTQNQNAIIEQKDAFGNVTAFRQNNWHIQYLEYKLINNIKFPTLMIISNKDFSMRIKISDIKK